MDVVVKKADLRNQRLRVSEIQSEERIYHALKSLQGQCIPRMAMAGILNGMEMILVTEFVGVDLRNEKLDASDRNKIRESLSAIHRLGIFHRDLRKNNIVVDRNGDKSRFFFIDFGLSKFTRSKLDLVGEALELESLLSNMPWPEGDNCKSG